MAANPLVLSLNKVYSKYITDADKIYQIDVNITKSAAPVADLEKNDFTIECNGAAFNSFSVAQGAGNIYVITIPNGNAFATTDYITIVVDDGTDDSDKLFIDFSQTLSSHETSYSFKLPDEAGSYDIGLDTVNNEDYSTAASEGITIAASANKPAAANSNLTINTPYLVHFGNDSVTVNVTINNAAGDASEGPYQVAVIADLQ